MPINRIVPFATYFLTGMLMQNRRCFRTDRARRIIIFSSAIVSMVLLLINIIFAISSIRLVPILMFFISVVFILIGETYWQPMSDGIKRVGDLSYGTYIYAFPIQQIIISLMPCVNPHILTLLTIMIVIPIAFASWKLIEERALGLKKYL